jgi:RES domain-containing protein
LSLRVWRIGYRGGSTLQELGFGSTLGDGRWHTRCDVAHQMVYSGSSRALCQLEKRVHCNGGAPKDIALFRLEIPTKFTILEVESKYKLAADWRDDVYASQTIGMDWLASRESVGMWVPSYIEPSERNLLLNASHPQYPSIKLFIERDPFVFDPRLFVD